MNVMNSIQKYIIEMKKLVIPHPPFGLKVAIDVHCYQPTEQICSFGDVGWIWYDSKNEI
jgi:hypothetical protein